MSNQVAEPVEAPSFTSRPFDGLRDLNFYMKLLPPMNWRSMDVAGISLSETGVK